MQEAPSDIDKLTAFVFRLRGMEPISRGPKPAKCSPSPMTVRTAEAFHDGWPEAGADMTLRHTVAAAADRFAVLLRGDPPREAAMLDRLHRLLDD